MVAEAGSLGRFDRYMLSQLMTHFGFFSLVLILVYWINRAVILFDQLIADGQSAGVFLELTALSLPSIIKIVLPLSAFAASLYVTNRMASESELTVVQATGFSPLRIARPVFVYGVIVMALMSILTHGLAPASLTQMNARQTEIAQTATTRLLREGQFLSPAEGITLYIREVTPAGELKDIFLTDSRSPSEMVTYTATLAYLVRDSNKPQLVMIDGMIQTMQHDTGRLLTTSFSDLAYDISSLMPGARESRRSSRELATTELLWPTSELATETRKSEALLFAEGHGRFAESGLGLVAALLGFSTLLVGGFSRFGVWKQVVGAIFLVIFIKGVETMVTSALRDDPEMWFLVYVPILTGLVIVSLMLAWATWPSALVFRRTGQPDIEAVAK
jgi:lipopolysaccharide export system permease protein